MTKIRVKDLAKEIGVIHAELIDMINKEFDLEVGNAMSYIDADAADKIRAWAKARNGDFKVEEKRVASRVIRRRRVSVPKEEPSVQEEPVVETAPETAPESVAEEVNEPPATVAEKQTVEATTEEPTSEEAAAEYRRKDEYRKLSVVASREITAPNVKEAPAFANDAPVKKERTLTPEEMARAAIEREEKQAQPAARSGETRRSVSKREVIEVRSMIRSKPYGRGRKKTTTKKGKATEITVPKAIKRVIKISESITVGELAHRMAVKANEVIAKSLGLGLMLTINQVIDADTATILASEFNYEVENVAVDAEEILVEHEEQEVNTGELKTRPPVVTVMGHVDHGKTSLLDKIRLANVVKGEAGGITQHIGAYDVHHDKGQIVFLDTPGHEAFTAMRARGAKITDICVVVVAADDGVMPQTREAISHSKAAGVPIIVAVNKMDKPEANPEKIRQQLTELELVPEEWGGDTIFVNVSAHSGDGINDLLDMIILQTEVMELKADPTRLAKGTIIESKLDKGRGSVATVLITEGILKVGDPVVCGNQWGKVRALTNDRGEKVKAAGPSIPVEVVGLSGVVQVGDVLNALRDEKKARQVGMMRQEQQRTKELESSSKVSLDDLYSKISEGELKDLKLVIKADVMGSIEALVKSIEAIKHAEVNIRVIHSAVGGISENDVNLAVASNAIVVGFNVRPEPVASQLAEKEGVDLRLYSVIYEVVDEIKKAVSGLLSPKSVEKTLGRIEIKQVFNITKVGAIGGGQVVDGKVSRNNRVRLLRDNVVIYEGEISSLKRFKEDVKEVKNGLECGIGIANYNDIKDGDIVEAFQIDEIKQEIE